MRLGFCCLLVMSCASVPTPRQVLCGDAPDCTIDPAVQQIVEQELDRLAAHRRSVIVVIDPSTGSLLGLGGRDLGKSSPWLAGKLAVDPGSIMKSFTIAAALESGVVDETTEVAGEGGRWRREPDDLITDHVAHGIMSVEDVLVYSSNIGTAKVAVRLGPEPLAELYSAVGLASAPLRQMRPGVVPDLRTAAPAIAARVAYGAEVEPTPLQLASSFSIFAAQGRHRPLSVTLAGQRPATQVITEATAARMQRLLAQTVARDDGTGAPARLPGQTIAGKTGTWQLQEGVSWANFVGFPVETSPRFVVLVGIETTSPGSGGGTLAAPSFARVVSLLTAPPP
ncbi:MAG: penicillin-binding transpeptidase domain-containing protein [Archangium sp.]|nr:penicillin-binding transpeptidase domain-containing protein [Archangium sp.]